MVMAQSLFIELQRRQPQASIDVLAPAWTSAIVDRMPQVTRLIEANFRHGKLDLGERLRVAKMLREQAYSQAIVLPNSLKSAVVPALARIPLRTGFIGEQRWGWLNDLRRLDKKQLPMTVQRFLALGRSISEPPISRQDIPAPNLAVDQTSVERICQRLQLDPSTPVLVLCPGAEFGASKQWPMENFATLGDHFMQQGWQVWLLGSHKDSEACEQIAQSLGDDCRTLAGATELTEAVDLLSLASLVVSNDSGLMHIAAALQRPLVAIYGSTDPQHTPPLSANHIIARREIECSPCFQRECPLQHHDCMRKLLPADVIKHAESLL